MYGKHGIQIRIWSLNRDNTHSWVRISYGTNKYVVDSNYNNTEVLADLPEEQASQSSVKVIAARSKAKAKPQKRETVELPRYQYCSDNSGTILYLRALQGHSGHNLIDPTLQDNVMIESGTFHHIYHIGCAFNLHSIINNGLIPGGQDSSRRQTVFFLPVDPRDKDHEDPEHIDFSVRRRAQYLHSAWKKHQDAVFWVDIDLAIRKGLTFYQTRSQLSSKEHFQPIAFTKS